MKNLPLSFQWDDANRKHCQRHGVTVREVEEVFEDVVAMSRSDRHSLYEERLFCVGRTTQRRHAFVAFTVRSTEEGDKIRPIMARYMHAKEIAAYEKARNE